MITKIKSVSELKQIFLEYFLNNTSKVTKISKGSVLNSIGFGIGKVAQKVLKETAIVESHLLPDEAFDIYLDNIAENWGIAARFGASQSQTQVLVIGTQGTQYITGTHIITGEEGIIFNVAKNFTIGESGWGYVEVVSQQEGDNSNVAPYSLSSINPLPSGHERLTNEFRASGGRDIEQDEFLKKRIKEGINITAQATIKKIETLLKNNNSDILNVFNQGRDSQRNIILGLSTQNGVLLPEAELSRLKEILVPHLSLTDLSYSTFGDYGVTLSNINYFEVNLDFRCSFYQGENILDTIKAIQINLTKVFDFRYWDIENNIIQWEDLFFAIKSTKGVKFVPEQNFIPGLDIKLDSSSLPKIKGFIIRNLDGQIIASQNSLLPFYYPNNL